MSHSVLIKVFRSLPSYFATISKFLNIDILNCQLAAPPKHHLFLSSFFNSFLSPEKYTWSTSPVIPAKTSSRRFFLATSLYYTYVVCTKRKHEMATNTLFYEQSFIVHLCLFKWLVNAQDILVWTIAKSVIIFSRYYILPWMQEDATKFLRDKKLTGDEFLNYSTF